MADYKKLLLISTLFFIFILGLGVISACENISDSKTGDLEEIQNELNYNEENLYKDSEVSNNTIHLSGGTFEDIQLAVDESDEGDTIELEGIFNSTGRVVTINKNLNIKGVLNSTLDGKNLSGIFLFKGNNNIVISGLTFINSINIDGIIFNFYGSLGNYTFNNCNFINNTDCLINCFGDNTNCTVNNCNFINNCVNTLSQGISSKNLFIFNCGFFKNSVRINADSDASLLVNCSFYNNNEIGISRAGSLINCSFKDNYNKEFGSIVKNVQNCINCTVVGNTVHGNGILNSINLIDICSFENNNVKRQGTKGDIGYASSSIGGAVCNCQNIKNCKFTNNYADFGGAISYSESVDNCIFENNHAINGGSIYYATLVSNSKFNNNYAISQGGAIKLFGSSSVINCSFTNNKVNTDSYHMMGGGALCIRGDAIISGCNFSNNFAESSGSAIEVDTITESSVITIENCKFSDNVANGNFKTVGYSFKNYGNGLIYNIGNNPLQLNIKNSQGLVKNTDKFKLQTIVTTTNTVLKYKQSKLFKITIEDEYSNKIQGLKVLIKIGGNTYNKITDKNGQIKLSLNLIPNKYTAKIIYDGDEYVSKFTKNVKITIKKLNPKLTASSKSFKSKIKTKKYIANLKYDGKPIKKAKVTLKINGKTFSSKTNSNGKCVFRITKLNKKGKYSAVIKYSGNKYYNKLSKIVKITIK